MIEYEDVWYHSRDGLKLYARDYRCRDRAVKNPVTVLCMHGLTRNSSDFAGLAAHLSEHYRVLVVDQRGRGRSDWDPVVERYAPPTYVADMFTLLDTLVIDRAVYVGTSLGGLMSFFMAAAQPERVVAMVINDIGPELDSRGLDRIKSYVGQSAPVKSWPEALAQSRATNGIAFPDFTDEQWEDFTRGLYREENGVPVLNYDPAIGNAVREQQGNAEPEGLWPVFESLSDLAMLVVHGELSDLLADDCVQRMREIKPDLVVAEVPRRGHAPRLTEPVSRAAIDGFLAQHCRQG